MKTGGKFEEFLTKKDIGDEHLGQDGIPAAVAKNLAALHLTPYEDLQIPITSGFILKIFKWILLLSIKFLKML